MTAIPLPFALRLSKLLLKRTLLRLPGRLIFGPIWRRTILR